VGGPARGFHGGASLLRRESVLKAGGYLDWLIFAAEDTELAMRLNRLGYRTWYDPTLIVSHARSNEGRDDGWASFYYIRNTLLINLIHGGQFTGLIVGLIRALRHGINTAKPKKTPTAILAGLSLFWRCRQARNELFSEDRKFSRSSAG
jgi:GT2 family glycosyltransferase